MGRHMDGVWWGPERGRALQMTMILGAISHIGNLQLSSRHREVREPSRVLRSQPSPACSPPLSTDPSQPGSGEHFMFGIEGAAQPHPGLPPPSLLRQS